MSNKCCVYVLNENPIYNAMFSVSIRTFRKHNPKIPITLFYVNDLNKDSWEQTNKLFKEISPEYTKRFMLFRQEDIFSLVKNLDINLDINTRKVFIHESKSRNRKTKKNRKKLHIIQ